MKDYGQYKQIIYKNYNPEKEDLTKEKFYELHKKILAKDEDSVFEMFRLTCFKMYDTVAHAFAEGLLHGEFEDALQDTYVALKRRFLGTYFKNKKHNFFAKIAVGTTYKAYVKYLAASIINHLQKKEKRESAEPIDLQKTFEINEMLQNPERVAISNLTKKDISKVLRENSIGLTNKSKELHSQWLEEWMMQGHRIIDIAENSGVSRKLVQEYCSLPLKKISNKDSAKEELFELLH